MRALTNAQRVGTPGACPAPVTSALVTVARPALSFHPLGWASLHLAASLMAPFQNLNLTLTPCCPRPGLVASVPHYEASWVVLSCAARGPGGQSSPRHSRTCLWSLTRPWMFLEHASPNQHREGGSLAQGHTVHAGPQTPAPWLQSLLSAKTNSLLGSRLHPTKNRYGSTTGAVPGDKAARGSGL